MGPDGELTIFSIDPGKKQYIAEQYVNGIKKNTASTPLEIPDNFVGNFYLTSRVDANPANSNEVVCVLSYNVKMDHFVKVIYFDLAKSSAKEYKKEVAKDYREELEKTVMVPPSEKGNISKNNAEFITAIGVTFYNGKPVVITEFGSDGELFINSHGLITVYNPDMTIQKQFLFPKITRSRVGSFGDGVAYNLQDDKLRLVANDQGHGSNVIQYGEIDLKNMTWAKYKTVTKDGWVNGGDPVWTRGIIWFPQNMLVTRRGYTFSNDKEASGKLIVVTYE
jgi:hypothetical protein